MTDIIIFLKENLEDNFIIYFIPLYILGGRPLAILSAQFLGYKMLFLLPTVVLLDTLQVPMFYHIYGTVSKRAFFQKIYNRSQKKEQGLRKKNFPLDANYWDAGCGGDYHDTHERLWDVERRSFVKDIGITQADKLSSPDFR